VLLLRLSLVNYVGSRGDNSAPCVYIPSINKHITTASVSYYAAREGTFFLDAVFIDFGAAANAMHNLCSVERFSIPRQ
jgi:hypothetical protein